MDQKSTLNDQSKKKDLMNFLFSEWKAYREYSRLITDSCEWIYLKNITEGILTRNAPKCIFWMHLARKT